MKKGFTLIELLAVIVILAVILAIAIPGISSIIDSVKTNALIQDEQMMVKATKNYVGINESYLPTNIGDSAEVTLSTLESNNYITEMKNPYDKNTTCNGYVMITKVDTNKYEYTPHLNCINDIGNKTDDKLIAHWKFDDFQEPTQNIFPRGSNSLAFVSAFNGSNYSFGSTSNLQQVIDNSMQWDKSSSITKVSRINGGTSQLDYVEIDLLSPLNTTRVVSFWYYGTFGTSIRPYNNDGSASLYYLDSNNNWVGGGTSVNIPVSVNQWQKITMKIVNRGSASGTGWTWTVFHESQVAATLDTNQFWAFTLFNFEEKKYATEYTTGTRTGIARDYSGNGNQATLQLSTTPKWVQAGKDNNGAYEFDGASNYIILPSSLSTALSNSNFTISAWIKSYGMASGMREAGIIGLNYGLSLALTSSGDLKGRIDNGSNVASYNTTGLNLHDNIYHFVTMTHDGTDMKLYVDGARQLKATTPWNNSYNNVGAIGHDTNDPPTRRFNGIIDDVRIYKRALSDNEIDYLYKSEASKRK